MRMVWAFHLLVIGMGSKATSQRCVSGRRKIGSYLLCCGELECRPQFIKCQPSALFLDPINLGTLWLWSGAIRVTCGGDGLDGPVIPAHSILCPFFFSFFFLVKPIMHLVKPTAILEHVPRPWIMFQSSFPHWHVFNLSLEQPSYHVFFKVASFPLFGDIIAKGRIACFLWFFS